MSWLQSRRARYGSNALLSVVIALGLLVVGNLLAIEYRVRLDTTEGGLFTLSDQTQTLLESLDRDVMVVSFYREQERKEIEPLLRQYAYHSDRFTYRILDPDREPLEARRFGVKSYGTSVVIAGDREERIAEAEEKALTNAVARAMQEERKVITFLTGHQEKSTGSQGRDGYSRLKELLLDANYEVRDSLFLIRQGGVPESCDLLVVAGPQTPFYRSELDSIRAYLEGGRSAAMFLMDPGYRTGVEDLLARWSIQLNGDLVLEESQVGKMFGMSFTMPAVARYGDHPVTEKHHGLMTVYQIAQSMRPRGTLPGVTYTPLARTSPASWGEADLSWLTDGSERPSFDPARDHRGPLTLAAALQGELNIRLRERGDHSNREARIVVFGDSDFVNNQLLHVQGNADLFLNAVSWLLEEGQMISIRPKQRGFRPITLTQSEGQWIKWLSMVGVPGVPVVLGLLVWWRRR